MAAVRRFSILDTPPDGTFDRVTALAANLFSVPIALVTIVDEDRIWFKSRFGLDAVTEIPRDPGLCASAICQDETYVVERAREDPRSLANPLVAGDFGLQFYAAAPLKTHDGFNLGTICLLDREPRQFSEADRANLASLAAIVVNDLELRLQTLQTVSSERQLRREASFVADTLQRAMLPSTFPELRDVTFDAIYAPATSASHVGGDWYDAFLLDDTHLLLTVGDVAGHGLDAAIIMGKVRQSLRAIALSTIEPEEILRRLDLMMRKEDAETMVTAMVGIVDLSTFVITYANAGHPPPLLRDATGNVGEIRANGLPLGLRPHELPVPGLQLESGSMLTLYTDGLTEATRDPIAGEIQLQAALSRASFATSKHPALDLIDILVPKRSPDDVAILVITFRR
ncbi:MAG: SpoIIE family protein phosphatase [Candidatus Eremiobacteraeota bacterium]|nr:SpoIIE family protein phosphatase [Candidatus Eremiobacteraeota bacterium]